MFDTSTIKISNSAFINNLNFIKARMKKGVRFCSVVKGNAYGHGIAEFTDMAIKAGVDYFGVYSAEEAYVLRNNTSSNIDIFIMGAADDDATEWAIKNNIEFSAFDFTRLNNTLNYSKKHKLKAKIHIEMETGMRRTGFNMEHIPELCKWLKQNSNHITFQGLFTHYAGAESKANQFRITEQISNFKSALKMFKASDLKPIYTHSACSAALLNYPETQGNMVRIGILQYGFWPNIETYTHFTENSSNTNNKLKRVISWNTRVMGIKDAKKGEFIGYGTTYLAHRNMKIAILPVGYSHGYSRNLSNVGSVLINGEHAPVVGIVNMNCISVDITKVGKVEKGDEVVLIGNQKKEAITVSSFSDQSQQLNYELLTRLPVYIPRIVSK